MGEYENNSTTNNYTSENDLALSITIYDYKTFAPAFPFKGIASSKSTLCQLLRICKHCPYQVLTDSLFFKNILFLEKYLFRLVTVLEQRKMMRNRTSDLRISRSDTLPLSHIVFTVIEVYYEVYITRVLHIARISNVDSVMFCK